MQSTTTRVQVIVTLTRWDRCKMWLEYDVWCWLINAPMSDPAGGHCTGRRSKKPVFCPDCDGPTKTPRIASKQP